MNQPESSLLLERIAAGDHDALGRFYDRYAGLVNGLALRIVRDRADAEDVLQEVFVQVWRQAARFDTVRGTPEAWSVRQSHARSQGNEVNQKFAKTDHLGHC